METHGIKETKELLEASMVITGLLISRLKDGFGMDDLAPIMTALVSDPTFKEALKGIKEVPKEFGDISIEEGMELAMMVMAKLPVLIASAKK